MSTLAESTGQRTAGNWQASFKFVPRNAVALTKPLTFIASQESQLTMLALSQIERFMVSLGYDRDYASWSCGRFN
jgi:hypothetical protein